MPDRHKFMVGHDGQLFEVTCLNMGEIKFVGSPTFQGAGVGAGSKGFAVDQTRITLDEAIALGGFDDE